MKPLCVKRDLDIGVIRGHGTACWLRSMSIGTDRPPCPPDHQITRSPDHQITRSQGRLTGCNHGSVPDRRSESRRSPISRLSRMPPRISSPSLRPYLGGTARTSSTRLCLTAYGSHNESRTHPHQPMAPRAKPHRRPILSTHTDDPSTSRPLRQPDHVQQSHRSRGSRVV
jgi:hypothetical protein